MIAGSIEPHTALVCYIIHSNGHVINNVVLFSYKHGSTSELVKNPHQQRNRQRACDDGKDDFVHCVLLLMYQLYSEKSIAPIEFPY